MFSDLIIFAMANTTEGRKGLSLQNVVMVWWKGRMRTFHPSSAVSSGWSKKMASCFNREDRQVIHFHGDFRIKIARLLTILFGVDILVWFQKLKVNGSLHIPPY